MNPKEAVKTIDNEGKKVVRLLLRSADDQTDEFKTHKTKRIKDLGNFDTSARTRDPGTPFVATGVAAFRSGVHFEPQKSSPLWSPHCGDRSGDVQDRKTKNNYGFKSLSFLRSNPGPRHLLRRYRGPVFPLIQSSFKPAKKGEPPYAKLK